MSRKYFRNILRFKWSSFGIFLQRQSSQSVWASSCKFNIIHLFVNFAEETDVFLAFIIEYGTLFFSLPNLMVPDYFIFFAFGNGNKNEEHFNWILRSFHMYLCNYASKVRKKLILKCVPGEANHGIIQIYTQFVDLLPVQYLHVVYQRSPIFPALWNTCSRWSDYLFCTGLQWVFPMP